MTLRPADYRILALILALTAVKGALWSMAIPLWQGPDENRHFTVVQFIAEHRRLPGAEDIYHDDENVVSAELTEVSRLWYNPNQRQTFSAGPDGLKEAAVAGLDKNLRTSTDRQKLTLALHLPPLYYLMSVPFYMLAYGGDILQRAFTVRLFSIALGVATVWGAFLIAHQVFPLRRAMWFTIPLLVSFQPMFTFVTSVVNTDALMIAIFTWLTYVLIRVFKTRLSGSLAVGIGLLIGAGLLTKPFILAMSVPLLAVLAWEWMRGKGRQLHTVLMIALIAASTLVIWSGWVIRSARSGGNPFYANPLQAGQLKLEHPFYDYGFLPYVLDYLVSLGGGTWVSFWADFGWIEAPMDTSYYVALYGLAVLSAVGLIVYLRRVRGSYGRDDQMGLLVLLALCAAATVGTLGATNFYSWRSRGVGGGIQGRYYLGAIVPFVVLLALGLLSLLPERWRPAGHFALRWSMIALNLVCLFQVVLPRYYM